MVAYYNEFDPKAAAWLRELIKQGHIAPGDVDERSISDVTPDDLRGYTQCHFFAGIGVWSYALRQAGWPDDRPVWTGSCPCQPFSSAGKRKGTSDERHLWPHWFHLISQCRPCNVFGEQVASKDGRAWFDTVQADMEALGFAVGAADLCAAGVGAPHIRQRLWFYGRSGASGHIADVKWREYDQPESVAEASDDRPQGRLPGWQDTQRQMVNGSAGRDSATERMGDSSCEPSERDTRSVSGTQAQEHRKGFKNGRFAVGPTDASDTQPERMGDSVGNGRQQQSNGRGSDGEGVGSTGREQKQSGKASGSTERMADDQLQQRQGGATSDNEARGRDEEPATLAGLGGTQRMADAEREQRIGRRSGEAVHEPGAQQRTERLCDVDRMGDTDMSREGKIGEIHSGSGDERKGGVSTRMADDTSGGRRQERQDNRRCDEGDRTQGFTARPTGERSNNTACPTNGFWRNADWLGCRDGKFRPVEPGTSPLVNGAAARVGRLRGYGNAIVAQVAQTFIEATQGW